MAKEGIDSFLLNCQLDEKFELIEAEFGLKGFAIVVKLLQRIYGEHGYYCEYNKDISLLLSRSFGLGNREGENIIDQVVNASVKRGIFDKELFDKYSILTSSGIQKRYLDVTYKRKEVEIIEAYLLLSGAENRTNVVMIQKNDIRKVKNDIRKDTSKVKESKVKDNNKESRFAPPSLEQVKDYCKERNNNIDPEQFINFYESKGWKIGKDKMKDWKAAIRTWENRNKKETNKTNKNQFNSFTQREYDMNDLEKQLLRKGQHHG